MQKYFDYHYDGPAFELFGTGHLVALAAIGAGVIFLIWGWRHPGDAAKCRARLTLAGILLVNEFAWHGWNLINGAWNIQEHLPLHSCSINIWLAIYVLLTRNYRIYELVFFMGTAGAIQTVLTPDAGIYGLPHFRAIQTLGAHGLLIIAMVYMTRIEGLRPTWSSIWKTMLVANVYMVLVTGVNYLIGSNYMFTMRKPATASLFDVMGPWPWYLLAAEFVAVLMFTLLYLPFAVSDYRAKRRA